jgi:hypothetical protein
MQKRTVMLGVAVLATALGATAVAKDTDAPADEYFGPFKYSALSVRMKITSLGRSYRERWQDDASIVHDAGLVESSFRVWAQKYPKDRWLPPTGFHLAQLYQEVQTDDARNHARAMYDFVAKNYPSSKEAHFARLRLAQGFPPFHPEPPVSPTPNPYGPRPGSPAPAESPSGAPAPSSASPAPAPSSALPSPGASASPAAAQSPRSTPAPRPSSAATSPSPRPSGR